MSIIVFNHQKFTIILFCVILSVCLSRAIPIKPVSEEINEETNQNDENSTEINITTNEGTMDNTYVVPELISFDDSEYSDENHPQVFRREYLLPDGELIIQRIFFPQARNHMHKIPHDFERGEGELISRRRRDVEMLDDLDTAEDIPFMPLFHYRMRQRKRAELAARVE